MIAVGWVALTLCCLACLIIGVGAGVVGTVAALYWLVVKVGRLAVRMVAG